MRRPARRFAPAAVGAAVLSWLATPPIASGDELDPVQIDEWEVPYEGRVRDPFAAGADEIWFVGQRGHYLGRFTPSTGEFFKRDLPDDAGPHNLIVGSDGIVWYAGNLAGYIGRYDPDTDRIDKIPMPDSAARDPHTLVFDEGERHIWFTVQGGNFVGRLDTEDRSVDLIEVPTPRARPYGIKIADDGTPWIVLFGTNKLASVDPQTLELTEHEIPASGARPRRLEITGDGRIWYADFSRGFDEWALPSGDRARAYGMASDEQGRVWVVETGVSPNQLVGFDTDAKEIFSVTAIPSGAGAVRHMDYHMPTAGIWFGTDENTLGRARIGE
jgi:virginiamycin B lyase